MRILFGGTSGGLRAYSFPVLSIFLLCLVHNLFSARRLSGRYLRLAFAPSLQRKGRGGGSDPRSQQVTDPSIISIAIVAVVVLVRARLGVLRQATTTSV